MADDVDAEAERAANAARAAVKRSRERSGSVLPVVFVTIAVLTVAVLLVSDNSPAPEPAQPGQTTTTPTTPTTTQPAN